MKIVDGHLDLAYNALRGREVHRPASEQTPDEEGVPSVGLPDLRAGHVALVLATIFCEPQAGHRAGYSTPDEAAAAGMAQYDWYRQQIDAGVFRMVQTRGDLPESPAANAPLPMLLLLEGADPIRTPQEIPAWKERGLRAVGLTWKLQNRFAGGNAQPGPLTAEGVAMARALDAAGIIHDLSHLSDPSAFELLDRVSGPVMASHSNCRAIVPGQRQISDEIIRAIGRRNGMIGINFFDRFLLPVADQGARRATLNDVIIHIRHICDRVGDARHVGLGTDMDGGLGRDDIPEEIRSSADLPKLADALSRAGFSDGDVNAILAENWLGFLGRSLAPAAG
ncbi:MAG: membrane dipeptidase [Tepidisphaeraceae bacterium]|jgi:membrane dipeptidase